MMKSFFKKLAFVMALAMVVTMAAPAAQAAMAATNLVVTEQSEAKADAKAEYNVKVGGEPVDLKYYGAPKNYKELHPTWDSSDNTVATVNPKGEVTGVKEGVATISITLDGGYYGEVAVVVSNTFTVEMETDGVAKLTFDDTTIKADDLKAGLEFYYYVTEDYAITVPLVEKITDKGNGVFLAEMYKGFTFEDGTVYGFKYGEKTAEFKCVIGTVTTAVLVIKDQSTYVVEVNDDGYEFDVKLLNAMGKDITTTAVAKGVYTEYEVSEDENGRFYATGDAGIKFDEAATAMVKVSCYELNENGEPVTLVDGLDFPVVAVVPTPYDIAFNEAPVFTIVKTDSLENVNVNDGTNSKIAVGDYGYSLLVKLADNKKGEVGTNGKYFKDGKANVDTWNKGSFRLESTNVSRLYVTDEGELMPNSNGQVSVLVYYTPDAEGDEQPKEKLVSAISLYVSAPRDVNSVKVEVDKKTLSTENVNNSNKATVTVNVLDTLNEKVGVQGKEVKIECTTKDDALKNDASRPALSATTANVNDGKVTFDITASSDTVKAGKSQTYNYKVTVGNKSETFSITVKAPTSTEDFSKYTLIFGGDTKIENGKSVDDLQLSVGLAGLSNNVAAKQVDINAMKGKLENVNKGDVCYVVSKDGTDITEKDTVTATGGTLYIDLTNTKNENIKATNNATEEAITVLDLTHGAGKYTVTIYEVNVNNKGEKYFKQLSGAKDSYTVENKLPSVNAAATKKTAKDCEADANSVDDIVKAVQSCFEFKVGDKTFKAPGDYAGWKIAINENVVSGGDVCFVNSVTFYMETQVSGVYVNCGTATVNDYITLK